MSSSALLTECRPNRTLSELPIPDGSVEANPTGLQVLVDDQGVLETVVDDLPVVGFCVG